MNAFNLRQNSRRAASYVLWLLAASLLQAALAILTPSALAQSLPSFTKLTSSAVVAEIGTGVSCAWADYDNDGWPDLLIVNFDQPNLLYHNNRDGTFTRITTGHLVNTSADTTGATFGDYDGDGYLDLFVTVEDGPSFLYHNDGGTNFTLVTNANVGTLIAPSGGNAAGAAWADYNHDGFLDLFVIRPNAGGTNTLYRNNGNGTFTAVTPGAGAPEAIIDFNNEVGFCSWVDVDNDGWPDLFIGGRNECALYRNLGGTNFLKMPSSVFDRPAGRPVVGGSWADYDGDGLIDLVMGWDGGANSLTLYRNLGGGNFARVTAGDLGNGDTFNSTFPVWADANNDGFVDLFVGDAGGVNKFYRNNGNGTFTQISSGLAINEMPSLSRSAVWADFNRDGWLDLFVNNGGTNAHFLYQNNGGTNAWISVACSRLSTNTAAAIGATVRVQARIGGFLRWQTQQILGGDGRRSPHPLVAHFGLGDATSVETLVVEWPGGVDAGSVTQMWSRVAVRQNVILSPSNPPTILTLPTSPVILVQPRSVIATSLPTNAVFNVSASGPPPLFHQWRLNGAPISGATLTSLTLPIASPAAPDNYTVVITNAYGATTSSVARILFPGVDTDGDRLSDILEDRYGTDPTKTDTDGDGLSDYDEIFVHGTNPLNPDTDGDGLPDSWEVQYGLNPRLNDANESKSFDGVTNLQKYQWNQAHPNAWEQMYPNRAFSGTNTISDYERFTGIRTSRPVYDRNDRLIGVDYSSGVSLAYVYDGNGNLTRQKWISRANETNGLPALFTFLNSLTNSTAAYGPYGDADGDGWSNAQEFQAGTNPNDALSKPDTIVNAGTNIAALQLPFTPTNFVMGVGQLDGLGAEEIVIGADGNPGTNTNVILILSQSFNGWETQRVDIGSFGVTSIAVGQPTNRNPGSIYVGLRQAGGTGRVLEIFATNNVWQTNTIAQSADEAAFVLGVRAMNDLLVSISTNGVSGALYSYSFTTNSTAASNVWNASLLSASPSHRAHGTHGIVQSRIPRDASIRWVDSGGIELVGGDLEIFVNSKPIPNTSTYNAATGKWYFRAPFGSRWGAALDYCVSTNGSLVTVESLAENEWLRSMFPGRYWIGLYHNLNGSEGWTSGSSSAYRNFGSHTPRWLAGGILTENMCVFVGEGLWTTAYQSESIDGGFGQPYAVGEASGTSEVYPNRWLFPVPSVSSMLVGTGAAIVSSVLRSAQTNAPSISYAFIEDLNGSGRIEAGDNFMVVEYQISGNQWTTNTLARIPINASAPAQSFALASANFLPYETNILFTAEPDGQLFYWQSTSPNGPLQRQVFSSEHQGKAWHALAGLKSAEPGQGLIGLRVDPTNPSTCSVFFWPPQQTIAAPPLVSQTAPSVLIYPSTNQNGSLAQVTVRLFDNEGNASLPILQFQATGSTIWSNATVLSVDGQTVGRVTALPTGSDHVLLWSAGRDLGASFTNTVLLRARASDVTLTGDYSATAPYRVETPAQLLPVVSLATDQATFLRGDTINLSATATGIGSPVVRVAFFSGTNNLGEVTNGVYQLSWTNAPLGTSLLFASATDSLGATNVSAGVTVTVRVPAATTNVIVTANGQVQLSLRGGDHSRIYRVESSTNLVNWAELSTVTNTNGAAEFREQFPVNLRQKFYRVLLVQ